MTKITDLMNKLNKPKKTPAKKEKTVQAQIPVSMYQNIEVLAQNNEITFADAMRLFWQKEDKKPTIEDNVKSAKAIEEVDQIPSGVGINSASMKDIAQSLMWQSMVEKLTDRLGSGGKGNGGKMDLQEIIGIVMIMNAMDNQSMNKMMMMERMKNGSNNGKPDVYSKNNDMFTALLTSQQNQNNQLLNGVLSIKDQYAAQQVAETKAIAEGEKQVNEQRIQTLESLVGGMDSHFTDAMNKVLLKEQEASVAKTAKEELGKVKAAMGYLQEFEATVREMAQARNLNVNEVTDIDKASKIMDMNIKTALANRVLALTDQIGGQVAYSFGRWFGNKLNGGNVQPVQGQQPPMGSQIRHPLTTNVNSQYVPQPEIDAPIKSSVRLSIEPTRPENGSVPRPED